MFKAFWAVATAASVAAVITFFPSLSRQVEASTPAPVVKGDRLDIRACAEQTWPYYRRVCLRGGDASRVVRMVSTDRIAAR